MHPDRPRWPNVPKEMRNFLAEKKETEETSVADMLRSTLAKAKLSGGDPFAEYRVSNSLPPKFEYGMNCFYDRICEEQSPRVAQLAYAEVVKTGRVRIEKGRNTADIGTIPVLFGVSLLDGIESVNRGVAKYNQEPKNIRRKVDLSQISAELGQDNPIFLQKLAHETKTGYAWRLTHMSFGCLDASRRLAWKNHTKSERLKKYAAVIQEVVGTSQDADNIQISDEDIDLIAVAASSIGRAITDRDPHVPISDFLTNLSSKFENNLLTLLVSSDEQFLYLVHDAVSRKYFDQKSEQIAVDRMRVWQNTGRRLLQKNQDVRLSLSAQQEAGLEQIWHEIKEIEIQKQISWETKYPKDGFESGRILIPEIITLTILRALEYQGGLVEAIRVADPTIAMFAIKQLCKEIHDPNQHEWYKGKKNKFFTAS